MVCRASGGTAGQLMGQSGRPSRLNTRSDDFPSDIARTDWSELSYQVLSRSSPLGDGCSNRYNCMSSVVSASSVREVHYRYALDTHLLPQFGRMKLTDIDVTHVALFVARMSTPEYRREVEERNDQRRQAAAGIGYSAQTIKTVLLPLSRTFAYPKRYLGYSTLENPVTALDNDERPGHGQHKRHKAKMGRDDLDRLIAAAVSPYREIVATAAALGTRMGETLGLRWSDVDFDAGKVRIEQQANAKREVTARLKSESAYRRIEAQDG